MKRNSFHRLHIVLYAFLVWLLYDSTIHEWDPWFAFVVALCWCWLSASAYPVGSTRKGNRRPLSGR